MQVIRRLLPAVAAGLFTTSAHAGMQSGRWEIGPVIEGRNYSVGMPSSLPRNGGAVRFAISPTAQPHYITFRHGSLGGKSRIRMRFRIEGPTFAKIHGAKCPVNSPATVTIYFQRDGDNWRTDGQRWWATFSTVQLKVPMGQTEIVAPLNARWTSVSQMTAQNSPGVFAQAKAKADRVGFTFGNCEGYGHGARATAPVRFIVTSFEVL